MCSSDKNSETDNNKSSKNEKELFGDKAKKILKKNCLVLFALLISGLALLFSGLTLYFQFFHKTHNFQAVVLNYAVDAYGDRYSYVVLINDGTYYEALFNAELVYSDRKDFGGPVFVSRKSKQCPIVLKPGERSICLIEDRSTSWMIPLRVDGKVTLNENRKEAFSWIEKKKQPYILHCGIIFDVIGESGKKHKILSYVGSMQFQKEFPVFVWPKSETNIVVNLLKPNFVPSGTVTRDER